MIELKRAQVEILLDEAVSKFGADYVYPQGEGLKCDYVRNGAPSCLVGQVLAASGVPLERLAKADQEYFCTGAPAGDLLQELKNEGVIDFDLGSHLLLVNAQYHQDARVAWGESVKRAKDSVEHYDS